jgi:hypothetical protein
MEIALIKYKTFNSMYITSWKGEILLRSLPVEQAVGMILAHDMTEIIPGESKKAAPHKSIRSR